jgi:hypothetical protein
VKRRSREPSEKPLLPPRLKDWKEGKAQIGIFLRTETGGVVQMTKSEATEEERLFVLALVFGHVPKMSRQVLDHVRAEMDQQFQEATRQAKNVDAYFYENFSVVLHAPHA